MTRWNAYTRALRRDARSGEWRLLFISVSLAVAALSSVGFLADRLEGGLQRDARQLLGGDAVLVSDHALPSEVTHWVQASGLQSAVTMTFPTMVRAGDGPDATALHPKIVPAGRVPEMLVRIDDHSAALSTKM